MTAPPCPPLPLTSLPPRPLHHLPPPPPGPAPRPLPGPRPPACPPPPWRPGPPLCGATRTLGIPFPAPPCPLSHGANPGVHGAQLLSSRPQAGGGGGEERGLRDPRPPHRPGRSVPRDPEKMSSRTALAPGNDRNSDTVSGARPLGEPRLGPAAGPLALLCPSPREPLPSFPRPGLARHPPTPARTSRPLDPPPLLSPARPLGAPLSRDPCLVPLQTASARVSSLQEAPSPALQEPLPSPAGS